MNPGPFAALGLPADPGLTDEEIRAAWRDIATATLSAGDHHDH